MLSESIDEWGIPLTEMSYDRDSFKNKIQEKVVGALREQAFVLLATLNGEVQWVKHKKTEIERLLLELEDTLNFVEIKGKWDKKKAAIEAILFYEKNLKRFITKSRNSFFTYYKKQPKKDIKPDDLDSFIRKMIKRVEMA